MRAMLLFACLIIVLAACGKKPAKPESQSSESAPAPAPEAQGQASQPNLDAVLADLTQRVRKFGVEKQRPPKDLSELVAHGYLDRIPQAPAGKTFAIDRRLQVYVAD